MLPLVVLNIRPNPKLLEGIDANVWRSFSKQAVCATILCIQLIDVYSSGEALIFTNSDHFISKHLNIYKKMTVIDSITKKVKLVSFNYSL